MADLGALTPIAVLAALYALGLARADRGADRGQQIASTRVLAGAAGIAALAVVLGPPLDVWATTDLAAHMIQHVVLLTIAPALFIAGRVPAVLMDATSLATQRRLARVITRMSALLGCVPIVVWMAGALALQTTALGVWHIPAIYDAAVANVALHAAEHLSFLATGLVFWWIAAGAGRRAGIGAAVLTVFVASLPGTLLGALMTLSTSPWYPHYATGSFAGALQDQQLAGVVMWAVGGMAYVAAGTALFVTWLRDLERAAPSRTRLEPVA